MHWIKILLIFLILSLSSCSFTPTRVVYPGSPVLITETKGKYIHIFVWSSEQKNLVDSGWLHITDLPGYTIHKYDWNKYKDKNK